MRIGAHLRAPGGLRTAVETARDVGAEAVQLFVSNPRSWSGPRLDTALRFGAAWREGGIGPLFVHAPYLVNIASPNPEFLGKSLELCVQSVRACGVLEAGGFSEATLAEDQDLTMTLLKRGWRVAYADHAIAWTEAPDTLRTLARQRFRWSFGTLQCAWKHREVMLRPRYGAFGMVAMPNIWIFQLLFPFISPVADLLFLWSLVSVWLNKIEHSAEYALSSLEQVVSLYLIFLAIDWFAAVFALRMEPDEDQWLAWLVLLQRFVYRQLMYLVVVKSVYMALKGRLVGWGKLERKATVTAP